MSETPSNNASGHVRLDQICDTFEAAWKAEGPAPVLEEFLHQAPVDQRASLVIELIMLDRFYRKTRQLELAQSEYEAQLPHYLSQIHKAFAASDPQATLGFSPDTVYPSSDGGGSSVAPQAGERVSYFGDYEIVSEIARGGMGVVYRARQISLNRIIALKMILSGQIADPAQIQRFQFEAEAVANLDHPGIVPIYDVGEFNGQHYFSMKLIDGKTLSQLADELRSDRAKAIDLVAKIADAVHHAHQRGILHRDLKPGNILVDAEWQPVVMDFGLARNTARDHGLTQTGAIMGTPGFMSPEQAAGDSVTTATDIYSLGAILYQLVCGRPPHQGESVMKTVMSVMHDDPPKPTSIDASLATDLELIILKCLNKNPSQRYSSAAAFAADLRAHLSQEPVSVRAPSLFEITRLWLGRNYGNILWVPLIAVFVGVLTGISLWTITYGQDMKFKVAAYSRFPETERPWLAGDWSAFALPALFLFLFLISTMGWLTAKLVRTKNRAADIGAGLSVGILGGLMAFISGGGAVMLESSRIANQLDREFLYQLAIVDDRSYTHERIVTHYPTLASFGNQDRTTLLAEKILGDQWNSSVIGIGLGALVWLFFFGFSGIAQTLVAGGLIRAKSLWRGLLSYACFSFSLAILYFTLAGPTSMVFLLGSSGVLNWLWPLMCAGLAAVAILSVLRDWHWTLQLACSLILSIGYFTAFREEMPTPQVAQHQTEISKAVKLLRAEPDKRAYVLRLVRAHHENANLLRNVGRDELARAEYRNAVRIMENGADPASFKNQESILYAQLIAVAGLHSHKMGHYAEAAGYLAKHTGMFQSAAEIIDAYSQSIVQSGKEDEFLRDTSAVDATTWWRFAHQARSIAAHKERNSVSAQNWLKEKSDQTLAACRDTSMVDSWEERKSTLSKWLLSKQRWELYGPTNIAPGPSLKAMLDEVSPIEEKLLGKPTDVKAQKSMECYTGTRIDLIREMGEYEYKACYVRTSFKLDEPQQICFRFGSNDSMKAWVDGESLMRFEGTRGVFEGHNLITTREPLAAGEHTLVLKIVQWTGGWGFIVDAADTKGWPIALWHPNHE